MIKIRSIQAENESGQRLNEKELGELLSELDVAAPQIVIDVKIYKIFADYTSDISAILQTDSKEDLLPFFGLDLRGSELRTPERSVIGAEYGVMGTIGDYMLRATLDTLLSKGFAEELAGPSLVVSNTHTARISKTDKLPIPQQTIVGTSIVGTTRYEEVRSFLEVTPHAAADGDIFLQVHAGTGSVNPAGPIQVPVITTRETNIAKVRVQQGRTLVIASFLDVMTLAIVRKSPPFSDIPVFGELFKGKDHEKRRDMILFLVRPYYMGDLEPSEEDNGGA